MYECNTITCIGVTQLVRKNLLFSDANLIKVKNGQVGFKSVLVMFREMHARFEVPVVHKKERLK